MALSLRHQLEELFNRLFPDGETRALARHIHNSGYVEKVAAGPLAAQGRVRGKRQDAGFNVRVEYATGAISCKCPQAKKEPCKHIGAFILALIARAPAPGTQPPEEGAPAPKPMAANEPDPEVYRFLLDVFPGFGPKRAREVARVFRSIPDLLGATQRQFRNLPEIGVWAAAALYEQLHAPGRLLKNGGSNGNGSGPVSLNGKEPQPLCFELDFEWLGWASEAVPPAPPPPPGNGTRPLLGRKFLVQGTKAGRVFFRPENPKDHVVRHFLKAIRHADPDAFHASATTRVWTSTQEMFPRVMGRLETWGAEREFAQLVHLPLDGLAVFVEATGRRARFLPVHDGVEEAYPQFLQLLKEAEGYEFDERTGHYLVLPKAFPRLRARLADLGASLIRKRLRPVREITEWREKEAEDDAPGTPRMREAPDLTPYLLDPTPPSLRAQVVLKPYQREGIAFIRATNYRAYIGDQPGLGKTLQAIVASLYLPGRVLVVCPAGARNVWVKEITAHSTEKCLTIQPRSARRTEAVDKGQKFVVASYDALLNRREEVLSRSYDCVILDEAHYIKNKEAERTRAVHEALRHIPRRLLLSGTPVMNRAEEVRKQLEFIYPDEWGNDAWFRRRFVTAFEHGTPKVRRQALTRLRDYFRGIMLRRLKVDVLKDLPPKHIVTHRVKMHPAWRAEYDAEQGRLREHVRTHMDTAFGEDYQTTQGHVMTLRQIASNAKAEAAEEYVRGILKQKGEKVVVFAYYLAHLETLEKTLAEFNPVVVHGGIADAARASAVKSFQEDKTCRVFLGQLTAAGTALTLTAARHAVFVDLDWNPANHEQAGDRVHRIGQEREVFQHFLVAANTVEEDIVKLLQEKSMDTSALLDGDDDAAGLFQQSAQKRAMARIALRIALQQDAPQESPAPA